MRIPSSHQQPNLSNSAPSHSDSPLHQWGASSKRPRTDHELYQQPGPSHANQADLNGHGEAGRGAHAGHSSQAPRQSALHSSRSKSRGDFRSDGRRSIRWNNSHESLAWSSQEDLAQLQPDRASADGVERPPEEGFTGQPILEVCCHLAKTLLCCCAAHHSCEVMSAGPLTCRPNCSAASAPLHSDEINGKTFAAKFCHEKHAMSAMQCGAPASCCHDLTQFTQIQANQQVPRHLPPLY